MDDSAERLAGRAWLDEFPWRFLTRLTEAGPRPGGSPGEHRAADLVREALIDAGADPSVDSFEIQRWVREDSALSVSIPEREIERSFEAVALPYSPAGDITGSLANTGHGTPDEISSVDVADAIAIADTDTPTEERYVHRMEKYGHAVAAGAAAFVFSHHRPGQLIPTGALRFGKEAAIPGVGISKETGDWLREYADNDCEAHLRVSASTEAGTSRNVVGTLGPDTDEGVLLVAHLDAHDVAEGALDNGCGITSGVTAARYLAECDLGTRVWIAGVGCEETGLQGSHRLAENLNLDRVRAVVNVDGAGRDRDLRALSHGSETVMELAERVTNEAGQPLHVRESPHPYSDHWPFLRAGVPSLQLHSQRPGARQQGRGWTHTAADTRDKVDRRTLREHALLTALIVRELTWESVPRIDTGALRDTLEEVGAKPGMQAAGVWPDEWS